MLSHLICNINNFIDYYIAQIYYANTDWPGNNIKFWSPHTADGKWKWILYDTDFGFGLVNWVGHNTLAFALEANGPGWPNPPWSTFLFRSLMENEEFQIKFINHFCYYLNTRFKAFSVVEHISNVVNHISPEMPSHISRWGGSYVQWSQNSFGISKAGSNTSLFKSKNSILSIISEIFPIASGMSSKIFFISSCDLK